MNKPLRGIFLQKLVVVVLGLPTVLSSRNKAAMEGTW
jgi:hypothetical protein